AMLLKYIFTSEKLSVQVHPNATQAEAAGLGPQGKEECWLVIDAEPGAKLGIGFHRAIDAATLRAAALDGSIEGLLQWFPVQPGDFFYIPANTVHTIGAGISLIELQQNTDITYRLYDYGRPRELHLDQAVACAQMAPYPPALHRHLLDDGTHALVNGPHFHLHRLQGLPDEMLCALYDSPVMIVPLRGAVTISGQHLHPGDCGVAPSLRMAEFMPNGQALIARPG
ncbi:MAG: class I mannose-6-phosphate isomerase, partial [Alphaproteobacteria bacterium]|nr:class I mannose-6-phosphate isomerase [Alphaproteobacteria bacterium]